MSQHEITTAPSLGQFDLLPPSFHDRNRVRQVCQSWLTIVGGLLAALLCVIASTWWRRQLDDRASQRMANAAIPLIDLKRDVLDLSNANEQRTRWCSLVEASRPSDDALQTLAALAAASRDGKHPIMIDSIHLRLPTEYPAGESEPPDWATAHLSITARTNTDTLGWWLDRLNHCARIEQAEAITDADSIPAIEPRDQSELAPVVVTATPLSTRVLP